MKNYPRYLYRMIAGTLFLVGFLLFGRAGNAQAVTISQLNVEINAQPGETIEQVVQLYDDSFSGVTVYPWVYNFTENPEKEGSAMVLTDPKDLKPDRAWIKFESNRITLPADGSLIDFPYRVEIPPDGEPGSHLIALVFRSRPPTQEELTGSTIYIGATVATNIFLKVAGATIDSIEVNLQVGTYSNKSVTLSPAERKKFFKPKKFFIRPPADFLLIVTNPGNTHQKPDGNVKVVNDLYLNRPEKLLVNQENKIILPGTSRIFEVPSYGQGFMFGKYRAKLTLLYGNPLRDVTTEVSFWIVPVVEIAIFLLFVLLLIMIWYLTKLKREKQEREKERARQRQEEERERERERRQAEHERAFREQVIKELRGEQERSTPGIPPTHAAPPDTSAGQPPAVPDDHQAPPRPPEAPPGQ